MPKFYGCATARHGDFLIQIRRLGVIRLVKEILFPPLILIIISAKSLDALPALRAFNGIECIPRGNKKWPLGGSDLDPAWRAREKRQKQILSARNL